MRARNTVTSLALVWAVGAAPAIAEQPLPEPVREGDVTWLSGGVGDAEQAAIHERADEFDVWLTLARADGAFLSAVDVRVENAAGETVLDTTTRGPFLLMRLPAGRYALRARADDMRAERRVFDVPQTGQVRLYVAMEDRS